MLRDECREESMTQPNAAPDQSHKTEDGTAKDRSKEAVVREEVEHYLERAGAGNMVELVRNIVGPEPLREQPRMIQILVIVCLGAPLLALLFFEWNISRIIPLWISIPLTVIALISYLWKKLRRLDSDGADRKGVASAQVAASAPLPENDPDALEARTLARLLISNIKLFNQELVAEGVRDGSIYHLLRKEIDDARSVYDKGIPPVTRNARDYFHEELVRILANGKADLL
jgi:hypothetical protein